MNNTYISIDVETKSRLKSVNSIFNLGLAVQHLDGTITKHRFAFDCKDVSFQEQVWDEFWSHHFHIYQDNVADAKPRLEEWKRFLQTWDELTNDKLKPVILSDNPAFDVAVVDKQLSSMGLGRDYSIRYSPTGKYIKVMDPSSATFLLNDKTKASLMARVNETAPHTHRAVDDAMHILKLFLELQSIKSV